MPKVDVIQLAMEEKEGVTSSLSGWNLPYRGLVCSPTRLSTFLHNNIISYQSKRKEILYHYNYSQRYIFHYIDIPGKVMNDRLSDVDSLWLYSIQVRVMDGQTC